MQTLQELNAISANITRWIEQAEASGNHDLVQSLLKQKLMLNQEIRRHVDFKNRKIMRHMV